MRNVIENDLQSEEAVKLYHDELLKKSIKPDRDINKDIELTDPALTM